jgi:hypothetical protein
MFKTVEFLVRKPGLSKEEFKAHYENFHRPLAFKTFPQIVKHVRNYPEEKAAMWPEGLDQPWDCIVEIYYRDKQGYDELNEFMNDPNRNAEVLTDGAKFLDIEKCGRLIVDDVTADRS